MDDSLRAAPPRRRFAWRTLLVLVLALILLAGSIACLQSAITQGTATSRARAGEGSRGTFVAVNWRCSKTCSWYGTFTGDDGASRGRNLELRGADEGSVREGARVRALHVGPFVQAERGSPEWGSTIANSLGTFVLAVFSLVVVLSVPSVRRNELRR